MHTLGLDSAIPLTNNVKEHKLKRINDKYQNAVQLIVQIGLKLAYLHTLHIV